MELATLFWKSAGADTTRRNSAMMFRRLISLVMYLACVPYTTLRSDVGSMGGYMCTSTSYGSCPGSDTTEIDEARSNCEAHHAADVANPVHVAVTSTTAITETGTCAALDVKVRADLDERVSESKKKTEGVGVVVGGCAGTQFGCCAGLKTVKGDRGGYNCVPTGPRASVQSGGESEVLAAPTLPSAAPPSSSGESGADAGAGAEPEVIHTDSGMTPAAPLPPNQRPDSPAALTHPPAPPTALPAMVKK